MAIAIRNEELNTIHSISSLVEDSYVGIDYGKVLRARVYIPEYPVKRAYLIISVTMSSPFNTMNKWKIVLNGVAITREYNPHIEKSFLNLIHSVFVYDVTTTIKEPRVEFSLTYDGKERIKVDTATLISIHSYDNIDTMLEGYVDLLPLESALQYHYSQPKEFSPNEGYLYSALAALRAGSLSIVERGEDGSEHNHSTMLNPGINIIETPLKILGASDIVLHSEQSAVKHVYSLRVLTRATYPRIEVKEVKLQDGRLVISIANSGESSADNVMVVALRLGTVLARSSVGTLKPQESRIIELKLGQRVQPSHVRIIWRKGSRLFTHDIKFS